jgi:hypothetical protein
MKIPKEYGFFTIIGLFIISYVLEATVDPLQLKLATPYEYFSPIYISKFPFSTTAIAIRSLAIFFSPLYLFSFFRGARFAKGTILLIASGLLQLYALQEVVSGTTLLPLEWSLSLALAGLILLLPSIINLIIGIFFSKPKIEIEENPSKY